MAVTPDGRTLVATTDGFVKVVQNGGIIATPALALSVLSGAGTDRGLMSIAVDPNFSSNGFVYLYYSKADTGGSTFSNRLSRFTMVGNTITPASETLIKAMPAESISASIFHMGGALGFGKDGKIYLGVGDQLLPSGLHISQDLGSAFGKLLRLNLDGTVPVDNPFVSTPGALPEIYAYGFRNPFSLKVDPITGRVLVNDVGEATWEEIDDLVAGANYGWNLAEGISGNPLFTNPLYEYGHNHVQPVCSGAIVGGAYSNSLGTGFAGDSYFFGDFCSGSIGSINLTGVASGTPFASNLGQIVALTAAPGGGMFYLTQSNGGQLVLISEVPEPVCSLAVATAMLLFMVQLKRNRRVG